MSRSMATGVTRRGLAVGLAAPITALAAALFSGVVAPAGAEDAPFGPADPLVRDPAHFDARRPAERELAVHRARRLTWPVVGDLIISRPLAQYAERLPGFRAVLDRLTQTDVTVGNLETTIFDPRGFSGAPYSWAGDWSNSSLPAVARDLRAMGFAMVARANNHVLDWGLEGMRETSRWLDDAGIVYAGVGETTDWRARRIPYEASAAASRSCPSPPRSGRRANRSRRPGPRRADPASARSTSPPSPSCRRGDRRAPRRAVHAARRPLRGGARRGSAVRHEYRQAERASYQYLVDAEDRAEILRAIRSAKQNADLVVVMIHSHDARRGATMTTHRAGRASS